MIELTAGKGEVTTAQILAEVGVPAHMRNRSAEIRVAQILTFLEWKRVRKRDLTGTRRWVFVRKEENEET